MATIYISKNHPAFAVLSELDGVDVKDPSEIKGNKEPLRVGIINTMPNPIDPVCDFGAIFSRHAGHDIELIDFTPTPENITQNPERLAYRHAHMKPLSTLPDYNLDAVVQAGFGKEDEAFEDLHFWSEITEAFDHIQSHEIPMLASCWGSHAALYHYYDVEKTWDMDNKISGVFPQENVYPDHPLMRDIGKTIDVPVSRYGRSDEGAILANKKLLVLATSKETGASIVHDGNVLYLTGHPEYNQMTLPNEYWRDLENPKLTPSIPPNVFSNNDPEGEVLPASWLKNSNLLIRNWVRAVDQNRQEKATNTTVLVATMPSQQAATLG